MSRSAPAPLENLTAKSRNAATGGKPVPAHHAQDSMTRAVGDMTRLIYSNIVDPTKKLAEAGLNLAQGPPTEVVDCIVIGAGLSGLSCADALLEKSPSLKVVVFDVNERVGGRTKTDSLAVAGRSLAVDCGGMWIGPMHTQMLHLCERFKIATVQQHDEGMHNLAAGPGVRASYVGDIPPHSWLSLLELQFRVIGHLDALAETVPLDNPAACPAAARLDAHSAASYFSRRLWTRDARDTIDLVALSLFGCHASQISMLYFLYYIRACGGVRALVDAKGGAQDRRLVGGTQQLCERLVEAVRNRAGDNVKVELGARVVRAAAPAPGLTRRRRRHGRWPSARARRARSIPCSSCCTTAGASRRAWWCPQVRFAPPPLCRHPGPALTLPPQVSPRWCCARCPSPRGCRASWSSSPRAPSVGPTPRPCSSTRRPGGATTASAASAPTVRVAASRPTTHPPPRVRSPARPAARRELLLRLLRHAGGRRPGRALGCRLGAWLARSTAR
jgi:hypothetical protein